MVRKNCKIGDVENVSVIELGFGDVQVGSISSPIDKYAGVAFLNGEVHPIGTEHNSKGTTTNDSGVDAMLIFTNLESFEVFEMHLADAKRTLINLLK